MKVAGRSVLVTGASSGIGRATALHLASRGARLALVGRDRGRLAEVERAARDAGADAVSIAADLEGEGAAADVVGRASEEFGGPIDAAVLAAGVNRFVPFDLEDEAEVRRLFAVNVLAPLAMTRALLPAWRARGAGRLLLVGSVFGALGFPCFAAYSASKAAIRGFSESLRRELAGSGVVVTLVQPRATRTRMAEAQGRLAEVTKMTLDPPERVGERIVRALERGEREVVLGFPERLFVRLNAVAPSVVDVALGKEARRIRPLAEEAIAASRSTTREEERSHDRVDVHAR